jgi:acyl-CoA synthetase (AMP-forming)/AMP-acid ligase II
MTASGSASAGTGASTRAASAGGVAPSQKSGPATMPQRPDGSSGPAGGSEPSQTATPGTGPCGQAAAASVQTSTGPRPRRHRSGRAPDLGRPEESAQVLRGGWLHTGDVGRFDDDGYLTLVDRVKDLIIRGGENIYPKEIEDVLYTVYTVPAVLEAAVVGQPDPVFGEQPVAFVTLRSGFDVVPEDLIEHCRQSLARYKVPREVYIEEMLPKNAVGKIAKPELRKRFQDASAPAPGSRSTNEQIKARD